jgi:hypothetical protein
MADLNTKVELMAQDITYIKEELHEIKELVKGLAEKKADRWVERAIIGVVLFVLTGVGGALLALIFK